MSLNQVYHYDGVTKTAITASVIKLSATQGVYPDFGGMTVDLTYPVLDANGSEVTLEKGDLIWCNVRYNTTMMFAPGLGVINDIKRSGDFVTIKAESMIEPLMRMRYVIDNGLSGFVKDRIWDIVTKYTPPHGVTASSEFLAYRRQTGAETWALDTTMSKVVHGLEVDVKAYLQYLIEQPVNLWLEKPTGTIYPVYDYYDHWALPTLKVGYTGYGNHRQADLVLSGDNGILSEIEWEEPTESILNDVTVTVRGGGTERFTDATSIAAYGKRQTSLSRGIYLADAIGGYDATQSIKSIVKSMCVPHKRCRLTCEATAIFNTWQTIGGMYRVIDELTGQDEYMALRSFTYRYPEEVCECEFDNAPLDVSKYGLRMENRVTSLESSMVTAHAGFFDLQGGVSPNQYYHLSAAEHGHLGGQDQPVKTTSSPTFAAVNIGADTQLYRSAANVLSLASGDSLAMDGVITIESDGDIRIPVDKVLMGGTSVSNYTYLAQSTNSNYIIYGRDENGYANQPAARTIVMGYKVRAPVYCWYMNNGSDGNTNVMQLTARTGVLDLKTGGLSTAGTARMYNDGKLVNIPSISLAGTVNSVLTPVDNGLLKIQTANGYLKMGPNNWAWCHFYTDRSKYYFNRGMDVTGTIRPYSDNLYDLGSYAQKWRDLYLGGSCSIAQNLTVSGDIAGSGVVAASALGTRTMSASSTVQFNNSTYRSTQSTSPSILKRLKVNYAMSGTFYIKWSLVSQGTGITVYGKLYKNGSALGPQRSTSSDTGATFTEGPFTNIAAGDEFQIQAWTSDPYVQAGVWDLQICFTPSTVLPLYSASE